VNLVMLGLKDKLGLNIAFKSECCRALSKHKTMLFDNRKTVISVHNLFLQYWVSGFCLQLNKDDLSTLFFIQLKRGYR